MKIFFSPTDVEPGGLWRAVLKRALTKADIGVFFLTGEAGRSPWVLFEGGAVGKLPGSRVFTIMVDLDTRVPPPFKQYQATQLERDDIWRLIQAIRKQLSKAHGHTVDARKLRDQFEQWWPCYKAAVDKAVSGELSGGGDWSVVTEAMVAHQIADSPFQAKDLFRVARHRIDLVAQNHFYITVDKEEEHTKLLRNFLGRKNRRVQILAMDPKNDSAVEAWAEVMGADFLEDLKKALITMRRWQRLAAKLPGTLDIRLTGLLPTSQNFFDPEQRRGGLIMVPQVNKPSNRDRPTVVIMRHNNRIAFDSYWTSYTERHRRNNPSSQPT